MSAIGSAVDEGGSVVLASVESIRDRLACPRCRAPVEGDNAGFECSDPSCPFSRPGSFPTVGRWVVLVDSDRSVLDGDQVVRMGRAQEAGKAPHPQLADRIPSGLRRIVKPRNRVAEAQLARLVQLLPRGSRVLVIGGGTVGNGAGMLYALGPEIEVIGLDLFGSDVDVLIADAHAIPLADESVDAVVIQAVLEHVVSPEVVVAEIHRVLRDDGLVYAETPFLQHVHAGAHDFTRFTLSGHRFLFRRFDELDAGVVAGPGTQLLWSIDHLARSLTRSRLVGRMVRLLMSWLRLLDGVADERFAADAASAVFFLGRRASGPGIGPTEIVGYYRGAQ